MDRQTEKEDLFWDLAEPLLAAGETERSTMMGFPCLRVRGKFFASLDRGTGNLVVKLPASRVGELIDRGEGLAFAPNGRVFREWVAVDEPDEKVWSALLDEARAFARSDA